MAMGYQTCTLQLNYDQYFLTNLSFVFEYPFFASLIVARYCNFNDVA